MPEFKGTKALPNTGDWRTNGSRTTDSANVNKPDMGSTGSTYTAAVPTRYDTERSKAVRASSTIPK